jgi:hypothetical protein
MKRAIYLLVLACTVSASCNKYLDIIPDNIPTLQHAFTDRIRAEKYLFTCYSYLPTQSMPLNPGMFSDAVWSNDGVDFLGQIGHKTLRDGNNVSYPLMNYWDGLNGATNLWQAIRDCNIFMENIGQVRDMEEEEKARWVAEVKFLKAYYHFFLLQLYGPIPIVRENLPISAGPEEVKVYREPVDGVVNYIVELIDEAMPHLPLKIELEVSELGRITAPVALAMKAKILVTAASPLFNGNRDYATMVDKRGLQLFDQTDSKAKWERAVIACRNAIDTCHLAGMKLFRMDNATKMSDSTRQVLLPGQVVTEKWNTEQIWGSARFSSRGMEEYTIPSMAPDHAVFTRMVLVPTLKMVEMYYSANGVPISEDLAYDYTNRYELATTTVKDKYYAQQNFVTARLHLNREPRFYGSVGFDGGLWYGLGRMNDQQQWPILCKLGQDAGRKGIERYSSTSFYIKKLSSYLSVYNSTTYIEKRWNFPVMRLADLYLLYAEALNESLDAPSAEVYGYVDKVRERAGLKGVAESWGTHSRFPQKYQGKEGMRDIIRTERSIELAFEGHRFWDIRRWKTAIESFNEPIKGWNIEGKENGDFYQVRTVKNVQYSLRDVLWPIMQRNIAVNNNLMQNPGW